MKRILYIILAIALLHSCKIGKNYRGTEFNQPTSYAQQDPDATVSYDSINTDSIAIDTASIRWWTLYDDPILDGLIREAFTNTQSCL